MSDDALMPPPAFWQNKLAQRTIHDDNIRNAQPMDPKDMMRFLERYTPSAKSGDRIQLPNKWNPKVDYGIPHNQLAPHQWYEFNPEYDPPWTLIYPSRPTS